METCRSRLRNWTIKSKGSKNRFWTSKTISNVLKMKNSWKLTKQKKPKWHTKLEYKILSLKLKCLSHKVVIWLTNYRPKYRKWRQILVSRRPRWSKIMKTSGLKWTDYLKTTNKHWLMNMRGDWENWRKQKPSSLIKCRTNYKKKLMIWRDSWKKRELTCMETHSNSDKRCKLKLTN